MSNKSLVYVETNEEAYYPSERDNYSPSELYPEYIFRDSIACCKNTVYEMIREMLKNMQLDIEHFGTAEWNPLGYFIKPGDKVLIKPNWVMDINPEPLEHNMDCLVTHPSLIRAVIDYVIIALSGSGSITVADAPVMECDFDHLQEVQHYSLIKSFYYQHNISVNFIDMRGKINFNNPNKIAGDYAIKDEYFGILVDVGDRSSFEQLSDERISKLRALNNDPRLITNHHKRNKHEYLIHPEVLNANVIINMPKPKSHRKAGMTACAKNFVGINVRKEYLPHASIGSQSSGGDTFLHKNALYTLYYKLNDLYFIKQGNGNNAPILRLAYGICRRIGRLISNDPYWDGSWYGNDTIWRTISDLNLIVKYADVNGKLSDTPQRSIFNVCDMIIAGEKDGPMHPSPKFEGTIVCGESVYAIDKFIAAFFGFNETYIKSIQAVKEIDKIDDDEIEIIINGEDRIQYQNYKFNKNHYIQAAYGWENIMYTK